MIDNNSDKITLENLKILEDVLSTFTFNAPLDENGFTSMVIESELGIDLKNRTQIQYKWEIWYKENEKINIKAIRKKLMGLLIGNGHLYSEPICNILLVSLAMMNDSQKKAIDILNTMLEEVVDSEISLFLSFTHHLAMKNNLTFKEFSIGNYNFGPYPKAIIESRCRRAGSDYAERYIDKIRQEHFTIYSEPQKCKVLNWFNIIKENKLEFQAMYPVIDHYFFEMSQNQFEIFFNEMRKVQEIPIALGSGWLDIESMKQLFDTERLSIWLNIGKEKSGWVNSGQIGVVNINLGGFHIGLPYIYKEIQEQFSGWDKSKELRNVIELYCSFLAKAQASNRANKVENALLNYVIALDLLLGEKSRSLDSFSSRCSTLTHIALGQEYESLVKNCKRIYNARSKYVHAGKHPAKIEVKQIEPICCEIAICLFRLSKNSWVFEEEFHRRWLSYVDLLDAKIKAKQQPTNDDYANAGVAQQGEYCYYGMYQGLTVKQET